MFLAEQNLMFNDRLMKVELTSRRRGCYVDVRWQYLDKADGKYKPSTKGIRIEASMLPEVLATLNVMMAEIVGSGVLDITSPPDKPFVKGPYRREF